MVSYPAADTQDPTIPLRSLYTYANPPMQRREILSNISGYYPQQRLL